MAFELNISGGHFNRGDNVCIFLLLHDQVFNIVTMEQHTLTNTRYILDGNALGLTATEVIRRRRPVKSSQPDTIIVNIGYPETIPDSPGSSQRSYNMQPPVCRNCIPSVFPIVPSNADNFIEFIDFILKPWIQESVFPNAALDRDALYGHSFGGLLSCMLLLSGQSCSIRFLLLHLRCFGVMTTSSIIPVSWIL